MTENERKVSLHPKSVNEREREYEFPWLVYKEKVKSSQVRLTFNCMWHVVRERHKGRVFFNCVRFIQFNDQINYMQFLMSL